MKYVKRTFEEQVKEMVDSYSRMPQFKLAMCECLGFTVAIMYNSKLYSEEEVKSWWSKAKISNAISKLTSECDAVLPEDLELVLYVKAFWTKKQKEEIKELLNKLS